MDNKPNENLAISKKKKKISLKKTALFSNFNKYYLNWMRFFAFLKHEYAIDYRHTFS